VVIPVPQIGRRKHSWSYFPLRTMFQSFVLCTFRKGGDGGGYSDFLLCLPVGLGGLAPKCLGDECTFVGGGDAYHRGGANGWPSFRALLRSTP
jgi:hypothetical protein